MFPRSGKKDPDEKVATAKMHEEIAADLKNGSFKVIVEAREAGKGVGIYDKDGKPKEDEVEAIIKGVNDITKLEWEAPIKNQQQFLILRFGINVSLGNIPPGRHPGPRSPAQRTPRRHAEKGL